MYKQWIDDAEKKLKSLFILYAVVYKLDLSIVTTKLSVQRLCNETKDGYTLCPHKIFRRMCGLAREVVKACGFEVFSATCNQLRYGSISDSNHVNRFISGKDYLIPLLHSRIKMKFGFKGSRDQLKTQLSEYYSPDVEPFLARRLRMLALAQEVT